MLDRVKVKTKLNFNDLLLLYDRIKLYTYFRVESSLTCLYSAMLLIPDQRVWT